MNMVQPKPPRATALTLRVREAEELMTANPVSVRDNLTVREALRFFLDKGISGAPVIDAAGRPVGVLTQTDLLLHKWETSNLPSPELTPDDADEIAPATDDEEEDVSTYARLQRRWADLRLGQLGETLVSVVMTPVVYSVGRHASVIRVIKDLCQLDVHRLFVVDGDGVLIGVISTMDVLRQIRSVGSDID